ncbi:hypothetical protein [Autumnicola edwardsiae]|uniref:Uncharacterized protein n=1 Tax=Autumnicola edwardsiae TaxID=3075594 RepID=A0ABU3CYN4_9FLAO|nr:hypothetical protein [Zunongwangia sp. F297]MDT0651480.1 hypothetical protein [Zunongwangia sp. F297]
MDKLKLKEGLATLILSFSEKEDLNFFPHDMRQKNTPKRNTRRTNNWIGTPELL